MPDKSPATQMYQTPGALFGRVVIYTILIIAAIYFLVPLFVMVITSIKTMADIRTGQLISWPREVNLDAWKEACGEVVFPRLVRRCQPRERQTASVRVPRSQCFPATAARPQTVPESRPLRTMPAHRIPWFRH